MSKGSYFTDRTITAQMVKGIARLRLVAALLVTGLLVAAPSVQAISFDFTIDHCTGGCGTAPFGSVTLTQNGGSVDVLAHLNDPNAWFKSGAGDSQAFLFNGIDITVADITIDAHTPALSADIGPFHANGSGDWDFGINCPSCANGGPGQFTGDILFHVANALISDLIIANADGNIFAADIIGGTSNTGVVSVPGTSTTSGSSTGSTSSTTGDTTGSTSSSTSGDSTGSTTTGTSSTGTSTTGVSSSNSTGESSGATTRDIPEPASLLLVGAGLVAVSRVTRRKRD